MFDRRAARGFVAKRAPPGLHPDLRKDVDAIGPTTSLILMVAITVLLAILLYIMVTRL